MKIHDALSNINPNVILIFRIITISMVSHES